MIGDDIFIKLYTHGAPERNLEPLLDSGIANSSVCSQRKRTATESKSTGPRPGKCTRLSAALFTVANSSRFRNKMDAKPLHHRGIHERQKVRRSGDWFRSRRQLCGKRAHTTGARGLRSKPVPISLKKTSRFPTAPSKRHQHESTRSRMLKGTTFKPGSDSLAIRSSTCS